MRSTLFVTLFSLAIPVSAFAAANSTDFLAHKAFAKRNTVLLKKLNRGSAHPGKPIGELWGRLQKEPETLSQGLLDYARDRIESAGDLVRKEELRRMEAKDEAELSAADRSGEGSFIRFRTKSGWERDRYYGDFNYIDSRAYRGKFVAESDRTIWIHPENKVGEIQENQVVRIEKSWIYKRTLKRGIDPARHVGESVLAEQHTFFLRSGYYSPIVSFHEGRLAKVTDRGITIETPEESVFIKWSEVGFVSLSK